MLLLWKKKIQIREKIRQETKGREDFVGMSTNFQHIIYFNVISFWLNFLALCFLSSVRNNKWKTTVLLRLCMYTSAGTIQAVQWLSVSDLQLQARIHVYQQPVNRAQDLSLTVMLHDWFPSHSSFLPVCMCKLYGAWYASRSAVGKLYSSRTPLYPSRGQLAVSLRHWIVIKELSR